MKGAMDWLKHHRRAVLTGSLIVIAGVAFVVVSAGAGVVVLAPVILMASSEGSSDVSVSEAAR